MGPVDARKFKKDLRKLCKAHGVAISEDKAHGRGSHTGLIFIDEKSGARLTLVIPGHKDISPGVRR